MEATQRFLPLEVQPGQIYAEAWYYCRPQEDRDRCNLVADAAVRAGQSFQQDFRTIDKFGRLRWFNEDIRIEGAEEGHWRAVGVCTDITERKRAEEERAYIVSAAQCLLSYADVYETGEPYSLH